MMGRRDKKRRHPNGARWQSYLPAYAEALRGTLDGDAEPGIVHMVLVVPHEAARQIEVRVMPVESAVRYQSRIEPDTDEEGERPQEAHDWGFGGAEGEVAIIWKRMRPKRWTPIKAFRDALALIAVANTAARDAGYPDDSPGDLATGEPALSPG